MIAAKISKESLFEVVLSFPQGERVKWGEGKGTAGEEGIRFGVEGWGEDKKERSGSVQELV